MQENSDDGQPNENMSQKRPREASMSEFQHSDENQLGPSAKRTRTSNDQQQSDFETKIWNFLQMDAGRRVLQDEKMNRLVVQLLNKLQEISQGLNTLIIDKYSH